MQGGSYWPLVGCLIVILCAAITIAAIGGAIGAIIAAF